MVWKSRKGGMVIPRGKRLEIGTRYGKLVVLGIDGKDKHGSNMYVCQCDCGNITHVRGNGLTSGNTRSCGCLSKDARKKFKLPDNGGVINHIILQYKRHARDRNIEWNLTFDEVKKIIQEPCFYCGAEKSNHAVTKNCKEGYDYNGIDRVDSSKGYYIDNVVPCCKTCNYAKRDMSKEDFINWANRISEYSSLNK